MRVAKMPPHRAPIPRVRESILVPSSTPEVRTRPHAATHFGPKCAFFPCGRRLAFLVDMGSSHRWQALFVMTVGCGGSAYIAPPFADAGTADVGADAAPASDGASDGASHGAGDGGTPRSFL